MAPSVESEHRLWPNTSMNASSLPPVSLPQLRSALEGSWDHRTAYLGARQPGNRALGQCYPTSRVVQWFFPNLEIVWGEVDTGSALEAHFWNIDPASNPAKHVDLTWQQFAGGSEVVRFEVLDRHALHDTPPTVARCELLLKRVLRKLQTAGATCETMGGGRTEWPQWVKSEHPLDPGIEPGDLGKEVRHVLIRAKANNPATVRGGGG